MLAPAQTMTSPKPTTGPPEWLETLYLEHHKRVYRAAYRVTGNAMDAEDVLQTVFLRLARREGDPLSGTPGSYLHLAAINAALDLVRARTAARSTPLEAVEDRLAGGDDQDPERASETRELRDRLRRALAALSPRSAEMFVLRYFEGYGNREIARMLRTSQGVVAVMLHRARRALRLGIGATTGGMS